MRKLLSAFCVLLLTATSLIAHENSSVEQAIRITLADGQIVGQVFAMLDEVKAPLVGKVSLTDAEGKTVSTSSTDDAGNFAFKDVEPGKYKAVGVAGDYVGDKEIEVVAVSVGEEAVADDSGVYTAIPLAVAPAPSAAIFDTYASLPAASFSAAPSFSLGGGVGGCSGCGGGSGGGLGIRSFGGRSGGGCGGCCGGGFSFRRLALIGGAIALPIALSGGSDDMATPDQ